MSVSNRSADKLQVEQPSYMDWDLRMMFFGEGGLFDVFPAMGALLLKYLTGLNFGYRIG